MSLSTSLVRQPRRIVDRKMDDGWWMMYEVRWGASGSDKNRVHFRWLANNRFFVRSFWGETKRIVWNEAKTAVSLHQK